MLKLIIKDYSQFYAQIFCLSGHMTLYWLKHVSHQSYVRFALRFATSVMPCGRSQTKKHTSDRFSLKVRCSHASLAFTRRAGARCACRVARLSRVRLCGSGAYFMGSRTVRMILAADVQ